MKPEIAAREIVRAIEEYVEARLQAYHEEWTEGSDGMYESPQRNTRLWVESSKTAMQSIIEEALKL